MNGSLLNGLDIIDLDLGLCHTTYCRASVIELYLQIKFH